MYVKKEHGNNGNLRSIHVLRLCNIADKLILISLSFEVLGVVPETSQQYWWSSFHHYSLMS